MRHGLLWPDGRLTDVSESTAPRAGAERVEVAEKVRGLGPHAYDRATRRAVPHEPLIAAEAARRAEEAAIYAEMRAIALERMKARGWPPR